MDQIFYVNSASFVDVSITSSLIAAAGSVIDFSQATGSYAGSFAGTASYSLVTGTALTATSASYAASASVATSASIAVSATTATSASYASTASVAIEAINATSASYANTASVALTAETATSAATASYVVGQKHKAGIVQGAWFSGNPKKFTVNFTSSFADTNYSIQIVGQASRTWLVEAQTTSSFIISSNGNQAFTGQVYWFATVVGEFNS